MSCPGSQCGHSNGPPKLLTSFTDPSQTIVNLMTLFSDFGTELYSNWFQPWVVLRKFSRTKTWLRPPDVSHVRAFSHNLTNMVYECSEEQKPGPRGWERAMPCSVRRPHSHPLSPLSIYSLKKKNHITSLLWKLWVKVGWGGGRGTRNTNCILQLGKPHSWKS